MSYRGTPLVIQEVLLDEHHVPVADSQMGWLGTISTLTPSFDAQNSVIEIVAQDVLATLNRPSGLRFNSVDHQSRPGCANDTGFDHLPKQKGKKVVWMGMDTDTTSHRDPFAPGGYKYKQIHHQRP